MKKLFILLMFFSFKSFGQNELQVACEFLNKQNLYKGKMVSKNIMLKGISCGKGFYGASYTLVNHESSEMNDYILKESMLINLDVNTILMGQMDVLSKYNYSVVFQYFDKNAKQVLILIYTVDSNGHVSYQI